MFTTGPGIVVGSSEPPSTMHEYEYYQVPGTSNSKAEHDKRASHALGHRCSPCSVQAMYLATAVRLILLLTQPPLYVAFQSTSDAQASWITLRDALASLDRSLAMQLQGVSMNGDERIVAEGDSSGGGGSGGAGSQIDTYYEANHVVLALPRSAVFTAAELHSKLSHFLEAPEFSQHRAKEKAIVPASFVFTLFFLYQLHAGGQPHADPVWHAWATYHDAVATGSDALFLWSEEELAELEEARMLESARDYRKQLEIQYDKLMAPLEADAVARDED